MISAINDVILAASNSLAASIVAKSTVSTALALIGVRMARRSCAAMRHALLTTAFGVLLVMPVASVVAPPVRIFVPLAARAPALPHSFAGAIGANTATAPPSVGVTAAMPRSPRLSLSDLLLAGWIAGMAFFLAPVVMGLWQLRGLRRSALSWQHGQSVAEGLAFAAGIDRRVEVLLHEALSGPMTYGLLHPAIVLSPDAQTWGPEDLKRALVHELEHIRRLDWVTHCLARALCAAHWFHPLVWIAWRQLALEAERSCDDAVLERSEATAYAGQLVGLAQRLSMASRTPFLGMANRADLAARVGAVLDNRQRRGRAGTFPVALAWAAAAGLVLTISPLRMVAAPQSAGTNVRVGPMPRFSVNTLLVMVAVTVFDKNSRGIEGLSANDFVVTEDGAPQTINIFEFQNLAGSPQGAQEPISSYYLLGYYTRNRDADGRFRKTEVTAKKDIMARLNYRAGYYSRSSGTIGVGSGPGGVDHGIDPGMTPPVLIYKKEPEYSEAARKAKYQGTARLSVEISASGQVTNVQVNRSLGLGLDEKAMEAVKQWKFKPTMKDGRAVATQAAVDVNFRLL